jgi:hypothetical protein
MLTALFFVTYNVCRAILHDPNVYPEPEVFNPERFLNRDGTLREDPTLASVFGFGKRICPGKHLVDVTLFIFAATVLSVFDIAEGSDPAGGPFQYTYTGGLVRWARRFSLGLRAITVMSSSRPNPFPCSITPRDNVAEALIMGADAVRA